jgi:hypothetical protein
VHVSHGSTVALEFGILVELTTPSVLSRAMRPMVNKAKIAGSSVRVVAFWNNHHPLNPSMGLVSNHFTACIAPPHVLLDVEDPASK